MDSSSTLTRFVSLFLLLAACNGQDELELRHPVPLLTVDAGRAPGIADLATEPQQPITTAVILAHVDQSPDAGLPAPVDAGMPPLVDAGALLNDAGLEDAGVLASSDAGTTVPDVCAGPLGDVGATAFTVGPLTTTNELGAAALDLCAPLGLISLTVTVEGTNAIGVTTTGTSVFDPPLMNGAMSYAGMLSIKLPLCSDSGSVSIVAVGADGVTTKQVISVVNQPDGIAAVAIFNNSTQDVTLELGETTPTIYPDAWSNSEVVPAGEWSSPQEVIRAEVCDSYMPAPDGGTLPYPAFNYVGYTNESDAFVAVDPLGSDFTLFRPDTSSVGVPLSGVALYGVLAENWPGPSGWNAPAVIPAACLAYIDSAGNIVPPDVVTCASIVGG